MKLFANFRLVVLLALALVGGGLRAGAAVPTFFGLSVTNSTNVFLVNVPVISTLILSNETGSTLDLTFVTNEFSGTVLLTNVTSGYSNATYLIGNNSASVTLVDLTNNAVVQLGFPFVPQNPGFYTNIIFVANSTTTNFTILTNVYEVYSAAANLAVGLSLVSQAYVTNDFWVITNDWVNYRESVTNLGPGTVTTAALAGSVPPGFRLVSVNNVPFTGTGTNSTNFTIFTGNLAVGASTNFPFTVEPTNAGSFYVNAFVAATNTVFQGNTTNNQASFQLFVTNYLAGTLLAATNSGQIVNPQNGLIEQTINVANTGSTAVQAVRVVLSGLTNQLYNASGTNTGQPFVVYPVALPAGGNVSLRLQYSPRLPFPFTNGQLQAFEVPASVLYYAPPPLLASTNFGYYLLTKLATSGDMLLEFTNLGGTFTVLYGDNAQLTNAMISLPAVKSGANRIQWLDYGPPATISPPTGTRYYRVILNP